MPESRGFNVKCKAIDLPKLVKHLRYHNGREEKGWEVLVGDETGCILLSIGNQEVADKIRAGTSITMRNSLVFMHENKFMRLAVNRWGKLDLEDTHNFQPTMANNRSADEYEEK